ncbi:hypothetical protein NSK11_contig00072-0005 [Nocardia seriolae]|uniref:Uncharacterized protein n=1 Tax=Nocardia seriolae TaxID=37332 RepID=A0ABC9YXD9_9NOCA|nr:hypothetical protein NSERKGN1266_11800 [Nocardia seriolae]BEK98931.1 hypothetical protein NSER024013_68370 [Nocardia seriolae]GAM48172.1 hypothetical protein NS07_v2contig00067-0005 [Nocardia seriolae]GAP30082.1 hypothetical protein NSK11_contig00072-0005 [Nocardia seriolae]GEM25573.1 hypothetical protein NS2_38120 [Nocardia seriolae NBRC 15557]
MLAEFGAAVVVARDPHHGRADALGPRLDQIPQLAVCARFALVGEIAGEHDGGRRDAAGLGLPQQRGQPRLGVDGTVELGVGGDQVGVAEVEKHMVWLRILGDSRDVHGHPPRRR